jgi:hypothetical protein
MSKYEGHSVGEWLSARKKSSAKLDWGVWSFVSRAIWVSSMMLSFLKVAAMIRRGESIKDVDSSLVAVIDAC